MARSLNDEEKLLVRRAYDKLELCEKRYTVTYAGFLNEKEQDILIPEFERVSGTKAVFSGGYSGAERRLLLFVPEYEELDLSEVMAAIRCTYYKEYDLNHRDFLGSLMGLGIEREAVGDIIVSKKECRADIVVKREILQFILSELSSAGRAALKVTEIPLSELENTEKEVVTVTDTVASPRIDAIASSGFGMSRENAATLVKSGKVYVDRRLVTEPDRLISDGALVNAQGYGKFKVYITGSVSKKGRMFVKIERYV